MSRSGPAPVRCYAGSSSPERPVALLHGGAWLEVTEVIRQERLVDGLRFVVLAANGQTYILRWSAAADQWTVGESGRRRKTAQGDNR